MNDRGEYRPFFGSILDDPDFQSMDGLTFKVLFALKMSLGPAGIGVPRMASLAEVVGCSRDELDHALASLEAPKSGEQYGWILRERNIIWLVNGLRHELLKPNNHPHKERIRSQVQALGDKPIVRLFRSYYHEWFDGASPDRDGEGAKREPKGTLEGVSRHKDEKRERDKDKTKTKSETKTGSPEGAFLEKFYSDASPERRAEVEAQLAATLSLLGARVRGNDYVRAKDRGHLDRCITRTMAESIRNPDRAIVVLLKKLQDEEKDASGRYPAETRAENDADTLREEALYFDEARVAGIQWARAHPIEYRPLAAEIEARYRDKGNGTVTAMAKTAELTTRCAKAAGFPPFEEWRAQRQELATV